MVVTMKLDESTIELIKRAIGPAEFDKLSRSAEKEADAAKKVATDLIDYMRDNPANDLGNLARVGTRLNYIFGILNEMIEEVEKHPKGELVLKDNLLGFLFTNINKQQTRFKQFLTRMEIL